MTIFHWYHLHFRRYAPFKDFGGGFEGDGRAAASTQDLGKVTARTAALVSFNRSGDLSYLGRGQTSGSRLHGVWIGKSDVDLDVTKHTGRENRVVFMAHSAGSVPVVPFAPDIDTFVAFGAGWTGNKMVMHGFVSGDGFPNCEVFAKDHKDNAIILVDYRTSSGKGGPFHRLFGDGLDEEFADFEVIVQLKPDGSFDKIIKQTRPITLEAKLMPSTIPRPPLIDKGLNQRRV